MAINKRKAQKMAYRENIQRAGISAANLRSKLGFTSNISDNSNMSSWLNNLGKANTGNVLSEKIPESTQNLKSVNMSKDQIAIATIVAGGWNITNLQTMMNLVVK